MKAKEIEIFDDVWYECYNDFIFSLIYTIDKRQVDLIYLNKYKYFYTIQPTTENRCYKSLLTKQMNDDYLFHLVFKNLDDRVYKDEDELFRVLVETLDQGKFVSVRVDMYYWLPEITTIYHKTHIYHTAFLLDYDDEKDEFVILDKDVYRLNRAQALYAMLEGGGEIEITELRDNIKFPKITSEVILKNAKKIVASIDEVAQVRDEIWAIENPTQSEIDNFLAIVTTHIKNVESRQYANGWLWENILGLSKEENPFIGLEEEYKKLTAISVKLCITKRFDTIGELQNELFVLLEKEKEIWNTLIEMKEK